MFFEPYSHCSGHPIFIATLMTASRTAVSQDFSTSSSRWLRLATCAQSTVSFFMTSRTHLPEHVHRLWPASTIPLPPSSNWMLQLRMLPKWISYLLPHPRHALEATPLMSGRLSRLHCSPPPRALQRALLVQHATHRASRPPSPRHCQNPPSPLTLRLTWDCLWKKRQVDMTTITLHALAFVVLAPPMRPQNLALFARLAWLLDRRHKLPPSTQPGRFILTSSPTELTSQDAPPAMQCNSADSHKATIAVTTAVPTLLDRALDGTARYAALITAVDALLTLGTPFQARPQRYKTLSQHCSSAHNLHLLRLHIAKGVLEANDAWLVP